jgi:predicted molibdopterin-dependent oxidoreductase YjgC
VPSSAKFVAAWDHLPRAGYEKAVVLPAATFAERQGSYTNVEGTVQFLRPPIALRQPLMEGWQVLTELASALGVAMDYIGIGQIQRELAEQPPSADRPPSPVLVGPARP